MGAAINKSILTPLFLAILIWLIPAMSETALTVKQEVVSGNIVQIYVDRSVKLDNGLLYTPSREGLVINLQQGEPVTLRYYIEEKTKNVFFEYAPGLNSLQKFIPPPKKRDNTPK